jgi:hypothetical protein
MMGGRIIKIASIGADAFGLPKIYFEQQQINRPMSLAGFAVVVVKEVECLSCSIAGLDETAPNLIATHEAGCILRFSIAAI